MDFKIIEEKKNGLFGRREVTAEVEADSSPSKADVQKLISEKMSVPEENIVLKKIGSKFGSSTFTINAFVYKSAEEKNKVEPRPKKVAQPAQ